MKKKNFHPSLLLLFLDPGSGVGKNEDPAQYCKMPIKNKFFNSFFAYSLL
jgi:hypothetical protein